jgi:hypothetical protein
VGAIVLGCALSVAWSSLALAKPPSKPLENPDEEDDQPPQGGGGGYSGGGGSGGLRHGPFGLGIELGAPTGITGKFFFSHANAIQIGFGYGYRIDFERAAVFWLTGDYLYHFMDVIPPIQRAGMLAPYVGFGLQFGAGDGGALFGVRVPLGMSFLMRPAPLEIFVEIAFGIGLVPATYGLFDGVLGARFYF